MLAPRPPVYRSHPVPSPLLIFYLLLLVAMPLGFRFAPQLAALICWLFDWLMKGPVSNL